MPSSFCSQTSTAVTRWGQHNKETHKTEARRRIDTDGRHLTRIIKRRSSQSRTISIGNYNACLASEILPPTVHKGLHSNKLLLKQRHQTNNNYHLKSQSVAQQYHVASFRSNGVSIA
ncbi:hypothetical protein Tcan_01088, partial [Toxocara canis]